MWIEGVKNISSENYKVRLCELTDGEIMAQELCQKGAMHAVQFILRTGVNEERIRAILEGLAQQAQLITAECRRRGLPSVDDPRSN
jgi:hypothetical protein